MPLTSAGTRSYSEAEMASAVVVISSGVRFGISQEAALTFKETV